MAYSLLQHLFLAGITHIYVMIYSIAIPMTYMLARMLSFKLDIFVIKKILYALGSILLVSIIISVFNDIPLSISVPSDTRQRYAYGFLRPSQVAEITLVMLYASMLLYKHSIISLKQHVINVSALLFLIYGTGSRAPVVAIVILFLSIYIPRIFRGYQIFLLPFLLIISSIFIPLYFNEISAIDFDDLNTFSSTRLGIWLNAYKTYIVDYSDFIFGSQKLASVGQVFHKDSFYVSLFISKGIVGLLFVLVYLFLLYYQAISNLSKSIILSCAVYGLFEGTIFNFAAPFGFLPLLFIMIENRYLIKKKNI